jgi:GNAT superfamily N-acetyltransferase
VPAAARTTTTESEAVAARAARALAFDAGVMKRAVEAVVELDGATLLRTPSLPLVPYLNSLRPTAALDAAAVEALAVEHDVEWVVVDDPALATRLADELGARGWRLERTALLGREGTEPPPAAETLAEEVPYGHVLGLRDEWIRSSGWATSEALIAQSHEGDRRLLAGTRTRAFATFEQGRPLAYALLIDGGRDAMLEDVYTTPAARGRGLATGVIAAVLHAARAERHETVFVPTESGGRPQELYERLGFVPLTIHHRFVRVAG